jgi:hypothetical protein
MRWIVALWIIPVVYTAWPLGNKFTKALVVRP